eukprot:TRINITY_DN31123_c0_g1_i1.p1 TRINITY_DN31123_c0_g1~~TRINITY_DN31123_c0_g1_i1.p1  ORF type:complete len:947 (-),score=350.61 TRINITY_DN31123_c0_g1_i1:368-2821(-)
MEAVKCFHNALRLEPESLTILRDLAGAQVQLRELRGHMDTRLRILTLKSNYKQHWMAYAVASDLAGERETAIDVIDSFLKTMPPGSINYEDSELLLYRNYILCDSGKAEDALVHLDTIRKDIMDIGGWTMCKGQLLMATGRPADAADLFRELLERGSENYAVHRGLQCSVLALDWESTAKDMMQAKALALPSNMLMLTPEQKSTLIGLYRELQEKYPKSAAARRIPLAFLEGDELMAPLEEYVQSNLRKGVPSLGNDLCSLFTIEVDGRRRVATDPKDLLGHPLLAAVCQMCDRFVTALRAEPSRLPGSDKDEPPSTLMWTLFLKSFLLKKQGLLDEALQVAEECIALSPEVIEMHQCKARVLKKMGAYGLAADAMDAARQLDLSDRYINNKTTKYMLRADRVPEAERTIALFTRHEGDPMYNLFEMQCSWFELEWAESHMRQGKLGLCLKKAFAVEHHFQDFVEDQVDFHTYCMRKMTLRAYVAMLKMEDTIYGHHFFRRAAALIIKAYLTIFEQPQAAASSAEPDYSGMSAADKKKAKAKARKEAKRIAAEAEAAEKAKADEDARVRKELEEAAAARARDANGEKNDDDEETGKPKKRGRHGQEIPPDDDPNGQKLAEKEPLPEAARIASILSRQAAGHVETWALVFDVAISRGKWLLALRAVCKGRAIAPSDPGMLRRTVELYHKLDALAEPLPERAAAVLADERADLLDGASLADYAAAIQARAAMTATLQGRLEAARTAALLSPEDKGAAAATLVAGGLECGGVSAAACREALAVLRGEFEAQAQADAFQVLCAAKFPRATAFGTQNGTPSS